MPLARIWAAIATGLFLGGAPPPAKRPCASSPPSQTSLDAPPARPSLRASPSELGTVPERIPSSIGSSATRPWTGLRAERDEAPSLRRSAWPLGGFRRLRGAAAGAAVAEDPRADSVLASGDRERRDRGGRRDVRRGQERASRQRIRRGVVPAPPAELSSPQDTSLVSRVASTVAWGWDAAVGRLTCWGEGCRVALSDGVKLVEVAAQGSATSTWQALCSGEGQFIYGLFRRQLAVFIPTFDPLTQIEAEVFMERTFTLRDLHMSPGAVSVLIPLAPPGLNFTRFWVSDVRVSWTNLLSLDQNPIVLEIDSVRAAAAELPAGGAAEIEQLIEDWLDVVGGPSPVPFRGKYPLLDGATFRVRQIELKVDSPRRYGKLDINLQGVDIVAVDQEGKQRALNLLCKDGVTKGKVTFNRLVECSQVSAAYAQLAGAANDTADEGRQFLLDPTPVAALLTRTSAQRDLRHALAQRWTLAFPGATRLHALPPLLTAAPALGPPDPRLSPFPSPPTEWHIRFADGFPFQWYFSRSPLHRPHMHPIAAMAFTMIFVCAVLSLTTSCSLKPWLGKALSRLPLLRRLFG